MSSWIATSPCGPRCLPGPPGGAGAARLRVGWRVVRRLAAVTAVLALGAALAVPAPLVGPRVLGRVRRCWALLLLGATGVRVRRHGGPVTSGRGCLVVANHVSWLDVLGLHAVGPVRMLAKREVRQWPVLGPMAARAGTVFLDRERLRSLPVTVSSLAASLRAGAVLGVFAEGTTRCGRELGDFRPAAFQAALDAEVAVQPVALTYRGAGGAPDTTAAFVGDDTLWASVRRVTAVRDLVLEVWVLPPLRPEPAPAGPTCRPRRDLARRCTARVVAGLSG